MSKVLKCVILAVLILALLWMVFILIDCIRLRNAEYYTYPLINLKQDVTKDYITYTGLGYTIKYIQEKDITINGDSIIIAQGAEGAEFRLFGKILIWAYIE